MINVLLVSPRLPATDNRYCGDNTYTDTLLQYPPPGVRYYHYEDLIATGQVRKIKWLYRIGPRLVRWGILPPDLWAEYLVSDFVPDILHIYGFSAVVRFPKAVGLVPLVLGSGTGSYFDLKDRLGWDRNRIRSARWLKRQYLRLIGAYDSSLRPEKAERVLVWSQFSRRMHLEEGYVPSNMIEVLPPGLPWRGDCQARRSQNGTITFLFVARDFEGKNGSLMLEAFREVRALCPKAELILVSTPPDGQTIGESGVTHYHFMPRQELLERIYPQADVLVLPSKADGFGMVLIEAMSLGMPVIGVKAWAMAEIVQDGSNGFLIELNSKQDLVARMMQLCGDPQLVHEMRQSSKRLFAERFSLLAHNNRLLEVYVGVLNKTDFSRPAQRHRP